MIFLFLLKFILCLLLAIDSIGSYRMLEDKWTALEEICIWLFLIAKIISIVIIMFYT